MSENVEEKPVKYMSEAVKDILERVMRVDSIVTRTNFILFGTCLDRPDGWEKPQDSMESYLSQMMHILRFTENDMKEIEQQIGNFSK